MDFIGAFKADKQNFIGVLDSSPKTYVGLPTIETFYKFLKQRDNKTLAQRKSILKLRRNFFNFKLSDCCLKVLRIYQARVLYLITTLLFRFSKVDFFQVEIRHTALEKYAQPYIVLNVNLRNIFLPLNSFSLKKGLSFPTSFTLKD